jgi:hypothetical protein
MMRMVKRMKVGTVSLMTRAVMASLDPERYVANQEAGFFLLSLISILKCCLLYRVSAETWYFLECAEKGQKLPPLLISSVQTQSLMSTCLHVVLTCGIVRSSLLIVRSERDSLMASVFGCCLRHNMRALALSCWAEMASSNH